MPKEPTLFRLHHDEPSSLMSSTQASQATCLLVSSSATAAFNREKEIKGWRRVKKIRLIESMNPQWHDQAEAWTDILKARNSKRLSWPSLNK